MRSGAWSHCRDDLLSCVFDLKPISRWFPVFPSASFPFIVSNTVGKQGAWPNASPNRTQRCVERRPTGERLDAWSEADGAVEAAWYTTNSVGVWNTFLSTSPPSPTPKYTHTHTPSTWMNHFTLRHLLWLGVSYFREIKLINSSVISSWQGVCS